RFQTHLSMPFIVHNMLLIRRSSYKSKITVTRAWWTRAVAALREVDAKSIRKVADNVAQQRARNDFSRYEAKDEKEERIMDLMACVNFADEHIPGSTGEVKHMREEIRAISRSHGTPSLFFTLNPADIKNPLAAFDAGHDIDLNAPFSHPDARYSQFRRAQSVSDNPVAAAVFYNRMFAIFLKTLLGTGRSDRRGVFGRVKSYYGVVE
ncbi:hypothetical protein CYLTODRAFT_319356, partial [Cylindrobasidium torrendii FP15055 ss-10]